MGPRDLLDQFTLGYTASAVGGGRSVAYGGNLVSQSRIEGFGVRLEVARQIAFLFPVGIPIRNTWVYLRLRSQWWFFAPRK
jgi:hypothetical protein